jgi:DNA-binding transcriptional MerR regulator
MDDLSLSIDELSSRADVPVRTIRYYISEGLLPGPGTRGKGASYGEEHLLRLRLIRLLAEQRVPLAELRTRLAGVSAEQVRELLAQEAHRERELRRLAETQSPQDYVASLLARARAARTPASHAAPSAPDLPQPDVLSSTAPTWRHIELAPGVELHVRHDAERQQRPLIDRLLRAARQRAAGGAEPP